MSTHPSGQKGVQRNEPSRWWGLVERADEKEVWKILAGLWWGEGRKEGECASAPLPGLKHNGRRRKEGGRGEGFTFSLGRVCSQVASSLPLRERAPPLWEEKLDREPALIPSGVSLSLPPLLSSPKILTPPSVFSIFPELQGPFSSPSFAPLPFFRRAGRTKHHTPLLGKGYDLRLISFPPSWLFLCGKLWRRVKGMLLMVSLLCTCTLDSIFAPSFKGGKNVEHGWKKKRAR